MDLTGERVRLRALREDDAPALAAGVADPDVVRYLRNWAWRPYGVDDARDFITRHDPAVVNWAVECVADGAFIGVTGLADLDFRNRRAEWGIWIGPPSRWGQGFGTEACTLAVRFAFMQLGLERVYLYVSVENERGIRAYRRAGFEVEGTLRRHSFHDGGFTDQLLMAVLRGNPLYACEPGP